MPIQQTRESGYTELQLIYSTRDVFGSILWKPVLDTDSDNQNGYKVKVPLISLETEKKAAVSVLA